MYGEVVGFARDGQGMPASSNTSRCESVESVFAMCWKNVYEEAIALGSASARREREMTYQVREIPHGVRREQTQADEVRERAREGVEELRGGRAGLRAHHLEGGRVGGRNGAVPGLIGGGVPCSDDGDGLGGRRSARGGEEMGGKVTGEVEGLEWA